MKAMVFAAGLGTRLGPLTDHRPKALVEIAGRTLLEIALNRLRGIGVREAVVNVHHFAEMVIAYLEANQNFGMHIEVSREETLLDTGGGLKRAAQFFLREASGDSAPFILHNVDVISTIDLGRMLRFHNQRSPLATLAVEQRESSRQLLFDREMRLRGRPAQAAPAGSTGSPNLRPFAFCGIHIVSPRLLPMMTEEGVFSIMTPYLRLAAEGEPLLGFEDPGAYWRDLGRPESLRQAAEDLARNPRAW